MKLLRFFAVMLSGAMTMCVAPAVFAQDDAGVDDAEINTATQKQLQIATWGGAYGEAQQTAILAPAAEKLSIAIIRKEAKRNEAAATDVAEVTQAELLKGCADGRFAKLDVSQLQPDTSLEAVKEDFFDGALTECGVASLAWSALILVNQAKFKSRVPKSVRDVFDTKRFPGKRAFIQKPENLFEFAAFATGSSLQTVYTDLQDPDRIHEIMERLDTMLPDIVWVDSQSAALEKLASGEAAFAMAYSGRAFRKIVAGKVAALWDAHVYDFTSWAISSKASNPALAVAFVALAISPDYLAAQARIWPYGPMRQSAVEKVGRHGLLDIELAPYLPTSRIRRAQAIRHNAVFWTKHKAVLGNRLKALLEGFPSGQRPVLPVVRPEPQESSSTSED